MFQFLSVGLHQSTASKKESNSGGQGSSRISRNPKDIKKENGSISARSSGKTLDTNRSGKSESSQQISHLEEMDQNRLLSARSLEIGSNFEELHKNKPSKVPALHLKKEAQIQTQITLLHMNELDQIKKLYEESQSKVKNLEDQVHKYEQTISELRFQLQESNQNSEMLDECCKDLKQAYDALYVDFENLQKDVIKDKNIEEQAEFELQIYKEKVLSLEKELEDLKIRKESVSSKSSIFDASTQEIEELYSNTRSFANSMYNFPQFGDSKNAKVGWTTADIERYTMRGSVKEHQEKLKIKGERIHFLEIEMSKLKTQIADLINIITEHGGTQLLDKIEDIVSLNQ